MSKDLKDKIRRSRVLLENPYAYVSGFGEYEAIEASPNQNIHDERRLLQNPYAHLNQDGGYSRWPDRDPDSPLSAAPLVDTLGLLRIDSRTNARPFPKAKIEAIVRRLHLEIWKKREKIWPNHAPSPFDVLDPTAALRSLGYSVELSESLGQFTEHGESFEVAGVFDGQSSAVRISRRFPPEVRRFTTAHELAHALLHGTSVLHRDRGIDGKITPARSPTETEADLFASYFLMPEKLVRQTFTDMFLVEHFELNEQTAFALGSDLKSLRERCRTPRELGRFLAGAHFFNDNHFRSIAEQFQVSTEAMAIRLEELRLF
jgi:Zn-dependent peptidase ImmA (M78 family)